MNYQLYNPVKDKIHIIFGYFGSFFNSLSGNSLFIVIICYIDDFFKKKTTDDYIKVLNEIRFEDLSDVDIILKREIK